LFDVFDDVMTQEEETSGGRPPLFVRELRPRPGGDEIIERKPGLLRTTDGSVRLQTGTKIEVRVVGYTGVGPVIEAVKTMLPLGDDERADAVKVLSRGMDELVNLFREGGILSSGGGVRVGFDEINLPPRSFRQLASSGMVTRSGPEQISRFLGGIPTGLIFPSPLSRAYIFSPGFERRIGCLRTRSGGHKVYIDDPSHPFMIMPLIDTLSLRMRGQLAQAGLLSHHIGFPVRAAVRQTILQISALRGKGRYEEIHRFVPGESGRLANDH
jgi:hypothetical protein